MINVVNNFLSVQYHVLLSTTLETVQLVVLETVPVVGVLGQLSRVDLLQEVILNYADRSIFGPRDSIRLRCTQL